jgi:uncharacterized membrane protein
MKFAVGILLTAFGVFWGTEGAGAAWPGGEAALPFLIALLLLTSVVMVAFLRRDLVAQAAESGT